MERKEPYATQEEFNRRVVRTRDAPLIEITHGAKGHIISAEKCMVTLVTREPKGVMYDAPHHHEVEEQLTMVMDGACDFVVDGKLYPLEKGDAIIIPPNIEHADYISDRGCSFINIFCPPREDYVTKLKAVKKG